MFGILGIGNLLVGLVGQISQLVMQQKMMHQMQDMVRQMAGDIQNRPCGMFGEIQNPSCPFDAKGEIRF